MNKKLSQQLQKNKQLDEAWGLGRLVQGALWGLGAAGATAGVEKYRQSQQPSKTPKGKDYDYGYKGGVPGLYNKGGELIKKAEDLSPQEFSDYEKDYNKRRGQKQLDIDKQVNALEKKKQDDARAKAKAAADATPVTPSADTPETPKTSAEPSTTSPEASKPSTAAPEAKSKPEAPKAPTPMQQWAKNFPKLAVKVKPGQSGYNEINNKKPTPVTPKPNLDDLRKASAQATMAGPSKEAQALMSDRTKNILGPEKLKAGIEGQKRVEKMKEEYDAYDLVLEYLFSQGHVDTISEAHYIMMQMSEEHIQDIVEGIMLEPINPIKHKDAQKTQKIYNLGKGTNNPNESESALKRTGPQLPGV